MIYSANAYMVRAEECVRLANIATDDLIRRELLMLRQSYLQTADRLNGASPHGANRTAHHQHSR